MDFAVLQAAYLFPQICLSTEFDYTLMFIDAFHDVSVFMTGQEDTLQNAVLNIENV
jgi:hypothetical protein